MTNDQLLEKLYEGSLTPGERSLLDIRAAESPEFAAEVQGFMTVVQLLDHEKQEDRSDTAFLESTRSKVITLIAAASAAGAGSAVVQSGGFSSLAGSATQWILAMLAAAGVGSVVLWTVWHNAPDTASKHESPVVLAPAPSNTQASESSGAIAETPAGTVAEQPASNAAAPVPQPEEPVHHRAIAQDVQPANVRAEDEGSAPEESEMEVDPHDDDYRKELTHYMARLEQFRIQKDVKGQAQVLLNIANVERLMKHYGNAKVHAEQSLDLWKKVGDAPGRAETYRSIGILNRETETYPAAIDALTQGIALVEGDGNDTIRGLLLGELAKVYAAQGNRKLAFEKMYACVVLLRRTNHPDLHEWERELSQLESSAK